MCRRYRTRFQCGHGEWYHPSDMCLEAKQANPPVLCDVSVCDIDDGTFSWDCWDCQLKDTANRPDPEASAFQPRLVPKRMIDNVQAQQDRPSQTVDIYLRTKADDALRYQMHKMARGSSPSSSGPPTQPVARTSRDPGQLWCPDTSAEPIAQYIQQAVVARFFCSGCLESMECCSSFGTRPRETRSGDFD